MMVIREVSHQQNSERIFGSRTLPEREGSFEKKKEREKVKAQRKQTFAPLKPFLGNIRIQKILEIISPSSSQLWPIIRIS